MHAIWKGAISFGLVYIPVRLYSAGAQKELTFKLLHKKDLSEVRYARICVTDGKEIPWEDIVKGYEYEKGKYIPLTDEDFEKASPEKNRTIEILDFTDENQIDTIYYSNPYYLEPEKGAENAYTLLYEALKRTKKIAVGRFIFHNHEHIGAIRIYKNILILHQFRYQDELKKSEEIKAPKSPLAKTEIEIAIKIIKELSKPFNPEKYADSYSEELKEIIKKKAKGLKISAKKTSKKPTKSSTILALLKESLANSKKTKAKKVA